MRKLEGSLFCFLLCLLFSWTSLPAAVVWSFPKNLSPLEGTTATAPLVKINAKGKGVAVWLESIESNILIRASTFNDGFWSNPVTLNPPALFSPLVITRNLQIALNNAGIAIVVWEEGLDSGPTTIGAATLIKNSWKRTADVAFLPLTSLATPQVAMDSAGNAVVIWEEFLLPGSRIQVAALPYKAANWSTPVTISEGEIAAHQPQIATGERGDFVGIWIGEAVLRARAFTFKAILKNHIQSAIVDLSHMGVFPNTPIVSANKKGEAVVIWSEQPLALLNSSIQTRLFHFERGKIKHLGDIVTLADGTLSNAFPDVKINNQGHAVAAWQSTPDLNFSFIFSCLLKEGEWEASVLVSDLASPFSFLPKVGIDGKGNAVIVWLGSDNAASLSFIAVQSSTFHKGRWSVPLQLSAPGDNAFFAQVATNRKGETVAIWNRGFTLTEGEIVQASHTIIPE